MKEGRKTRAKASAVGKGPSEAATLVVVESPAKARSIQKMLGPGYEVRASKGHVADLPERSLGVDVERGFTPTYVVKEDKKEVVEELKKAAQGKRVLVATDPDREGEAIGWHLLRLLGRDPKEPVRVEFREITPRAVQKEIQNPRPIDQNLVDAQQARRVLDRLLGYNLSPLLSVAFRRRALSAGRVQSVALRLLVEREEEIRAFRPEGYYLVHGEFAVGEVGFPADLYAWDEERLWTGEPTKEGRLHLRTEAEAEALREVLLRLAYRVDRVEAQETRKAPPPPFTTSTLQQAASTRLGYTAGRTMRIAQRLYEGVDLPEGTVGLITYMRTDSVRVAPEAIALAREVIREVFGTAYLPEAPRVYRPKREGVQDAHEAIRPTDPRRLPEQVRPYLSEEEYRLYDLIWRRFLASQMKEALYDGLRVWVLGEGEGHRALFRASGSSLRFEGYLKAWGREAEEEEEKALPPGLKEASSGIPARLLGLSLEAKTTKPPPRYTDASLVKTMEELGVGRPSTYAPTLETLEKRGYMERQGRALRPTPLGEEVTRYLKAHFPQVVAYEFTARMEEELDQVEEGKLPWPKVVQEFYEPFLEELSRQTPPRCPKCGRPLELKVGRYGSFLGCTGYPECTYTEPLERDEPLEETCPKCGRPLVRKRGRYGLFIACTGYPECDYTREDGEATGLACPKCGRPILKKRGRYGKAYYRCAECDFLSFWALTSEPCPECGWPQAEVTRVTRKRTLQRTSGRKGPLACLNPDCPRHDPSLLPKPLEKDQARPKRTRAKAKAKV